VLNIQETDARAYWSRWHEIEHRVGESPQQRRRFFCHRTDQGNRLEQIIDQGAAEIAFPMSVYGARVAQFDNHDLTWGLVRLAQRHFAPTSSLLSAAKAFIGFWPHPAFLLTAALKISKQRPNLAPALTTRISVVRIRLPLP
jgi:hypothetical protein